MNIKKVKINKSIPSRLETSCPLIKIEVFKFKKDILANNKIEYTRLINVSNSITKQKNLL
jgi:hypothetical protein